MTRERHDLFEARSILNMLKGWNCASPTVFFSKEQYAKGIDVYKIYVYVLFL